MYWKRIKNLLGMFWFSLVLSFGSFLFYQDATKDSSVLKAYTGEVVDCGLTKHYSSTRYGASSSTVYYLKLDGLDEIIATYTMDQEYTELQDKIFRGDVVTVSYKPSINKSEPNIDTYQIEKKGILLLDESTYRNKRLIGAILAGLGAMFVIAYGVRVDRRYRKIK